MAHKNLSKETNVFGALFRFCLPLIVANVIAQSYNLVDLIIAGRAIGSDALSATGCTSTLIQFLSSLFWGYGVAMSTVIGERYGRDDRDGCVKAMKTGLLFVSLAMFALCALCFVIAPQILTWLKVDSSIFDSALSYFRIYLVALFFQSISYQTTSILHGIGNSKFPMVMTSLSGLGNVGLNLLFVLAFKMGVEGLAYATIACNVISFALGFAYTVKTIKEFGGDGRIGFDQSAFKELGKLAIPCILQQCALYLSSVVVQPAVNGMGKAYSAGYSVAMNFQVLLNAVYHALSRSTATYASQSKGAGKHENYGKGIGYGLLIQAILVTPIGILSMIFPNQIFAIFLKNNDASCLPYATAFAYYCVPFLYFICFGNLMHSFFKSVEATKTVVITTALFTVCRITLTYVLPENGNLSSVYLALSLSWVFEALLLLGFYLSGVWKSKEVKEYLVEYKRKKQDAE